MKCFQLAYTEFDEHHDSENVFRSLNRERASKDEAKLNKARSGLLWFHSGVYHSYLNYPCGESDLIALFWAQLYAMRYNKNPDSGHGSEIKLSLSYLAPVSFRNLIRL